MKLPLGKGMFAEIDQEDWYKVTQYSWFLGTNGYVMCRAKAIHKYGSLLHRFIMDVTDPSIWVDHDNRNKLDCVRTNLILVTPSENSWNRGRVRGYYLEKGRYRVVITVNDARISVGMFGTEQEAKQAYLTACCKYRGGRYPNIPTDS